MSDEASNPSAESVDAAFDSARSNFSTNTSTSSSVQECPLQQAKKKLHRKASRRCKHQGLKVVCDHGRAAGVLPAWAPNADPTSQGLVLQVLAEDTVTATTKAVAGPCGTHHNLIHISDAEHRKLSGATGSFKAESPELTWINDWEYIVWPYEPRFTAHEITAESCSGASDPAVAVQVFPNIWNKITFSANLGDDTKANLEKHGGGKHTYETTWDNKISLEAEFKVNGVKTKFGFSDDESDKKFRSFPKLCKNVGGATGWLAAKCGKLGGCEITFKGPNGKLTGEWGWKEDSKSPACGFEFTGSIALDPLFGLECEKDIADYVFAAWPAAIALKHALEESDSGELKIILKAAVQSAGTISGTKQLTRQTGKFEGSVEGSIEVSATGKAAVEKEVFWVKVSAGVEVAVKTGLKAAIKGEWADEGPAISASLSFTGLIFTACGWAGVNSTIKTNHGKTRDKTEDKLSKEYEWEAIPPKNDFLETPKWYPFKS